MKLEVLLCGGGRTPTPGWRLGRTQPLSYLEGVAHLLRSLEFIHGEHTHRCEEHGEPAEPQEGSVRAVSEPSLLRFYFKHKHLFSP